MLPVNKFHIVLVLLMALGLSSCGDRIDTGLETLPYFDLKGFIDREIKEIDGVNVTKVSRIQGKEEQVNVEYSIEDWRNEFEVFTQADINKSSLIQSYDTKIDSRSLTHELYPDSEAKLQYMKISYFEDEVRSIEIKLKEDNLFYSSVTLAELYMNSKTQKIDHYAIETTQKIWFLDPNNMKISGAIK